MPDHILAVLKSKNTRVMACPCPALGLNIMMHKL